MRLLILGFSDIGILFRHCWFFHQQCSTAAFLADVVGENTNSGMKGDDC